MTEMVARVTKRMVLQDEMVRMLKLGVKIIPLHHPSGSGCSCGKPHCGSPGKHPVDSKWQVKGTQSEASVAKRVRQNYGIVTGDGLFVVDVDNNREGDINLRTFEEEYAELPDTLTVETGNGFHYYFLSPKDAVIGNSVNKLADGIDIRGNGGFVVGPGSTHFTGKLYCVDEGASNEIAMAPPWLIEFIGKTKRKLAKQGNADGVIMGGRNDHLTSLAGTLRRKNMGASQVKAHLLMENQDVCKPPLPEEEVRQIAASAGRNFTSSMECWEDLLERTKMGNVLASRSNVSAFVRNDMSIAGCLGYDKRQAAIVWTRKPPATVEHTVTEGDRFEDHHEAIISTLYYRRYQVAPSRESCFFGIEAAARLNTFDPVVTYLQDLVWDGKPRLDTWLIEHAGALDKPYNRLVGVCMLLAAVARAFQPGCKVDTVFVLEGKQGIGKSTLVAIMGGPFTTSSMLNLHDKQAAMQLDSAWFFEMAELTGLKRASIEKVKAFITRTEDTYRPPYGRMNIRVPRSCIFIGTTNEQNYLEDEENRRFLPIWVKKIDFGKLAAARDMLFAEAVERYHKGEKWHPEAQGDAMKRSVLAEASQRLNWDPWAEFVDKWLRTRFRKVDFNGRYTANTLEETRELCKYFVTGQQIALEALSFDISKYDSNNSKRIGKLMRNNLTWERKRHNGKRGWIPSKKWIENADD